MLANEVAPITDLHLHKLRVQQRTEIAAPFLQDARIDTYFDDVLERMVASMEADVLTHRIAKSTYSTTISYPASPWHHFKYKHRNSRLMAWWIKRHPIEYTEKEAVMTFNKEHRFPEAKLRSYPDVLGIAVPVEEGILTLT